MNWGRRSVTVATTVLALVCCAQDWSVQAMDHMQLHEIDRDVEQLETYLSRAARPDYHRIAEIGLSLVARAGPGTGLKDMFSDAAGGLSAPGNRTLQPGDMGPSSGAEGSISTVPIELALSQVSLQTGSNYHIELKDAQSRKGKPVLVLQTGNWTLKRLAGQLKVQGLDNILEPVEGGFRASVPIAIWREADLSLTKQDRLELSTKGGAFLLNAGSLRLRNAELTASSDSNRLEEFRPFVLTALGGRTLIQNSVVSGLGFGDRPHMRGVSFVSSAFFPVQTEALIVGSTFDGVHSIELDNMKGGLVARNLITNASGTGLRLQGSRESEVVSNIIVNSAQHGLSLASGTSDVKIVRNMLAANRKAGLYARSGVTAGKIEENLVVGNLKSGISLSENGCMDVSGNVVLRNGLWGIAAKKSFKLSFRENALIRNHGPGLAVETSVFPQDTHAISNNRFVANRAGILAERYAALALTGNDLSGQTPILFSGELKSHIPQYLSWSQGKGSGKPSVFLARSLATDQKPQGDGAQLKDFAVTALANCQN